MACRRQSTDQHLSTTLISPLICLYSILMAPCGAFFMPMLEMRKWMLEMC